MTPFQTRLTVAASRRHRLGLGAAGALALGLLATSAVPTQEDDDRVDGARATIEEYVETRKLISSERRDWAVERELLEARIALLQEEIEAFEERIAVANESIEGTDQDRLEQAATQERLQATITGVNEAIVEIEAGVRGLLPRLPEPAREQVQLAAGQIPDEGEETDLSIGIRIQNSIGVLDQLNKFDRAIHVGSALVTASSGEQISAQTIHVGLGRAYYANSETAERLFAGSGPAPFEGDDPRWEWEARDEAHAKIIELIKVHESELPPAFVRVPILDPIPTIDQ